MFAVVLLFEAAKPEAFAVVQTVGVVVVVEAALGRKRRFFFLAYRGATLSELGVIVWRYFHIC